jgi:hypothetical protein
MKTITLLALGMVLSSSTLLFSAEPGPTPVPTPTPPTTPAKDEMPLALYQKFKGYFDSLYGAKTTLLPGLDSNDNKQEVEKSLRTEASANKDVLIKALSSTAVIHRELSARVLEYCDDKKAAVAALSLALIQDKEVGVRRAAAASLAKLPDAGAVDALIKALSDTNDAVRGLSATALGTIKDNRASKPLLQVINDDAKPIVRMQAANALAKIKDATLVEDLKKSLDNEKDERVRMAIAGALRTIMNTEGDETAKIPSAEEASGELAALAKEMEEVEEKLRKDRHDQAVQVQGAGIEKKLNQLIEKLAQASGSGQGKPEKGQKQQQQQQSGKQPGSKSGGSPMQDSQLGGAVPPGAANAALVAGKQDAWAKLPPAERDEMIQAKNLGMPARWEKRLEAYYISVNKADVKSDK